MKENTRLLLNKAERAIQAEEFLEAARKYLESQSS